MSLKILAVAALLALAACAGPTGPADLCTPDSDNPNQRNCPAEAQ